MLTVMPIFQYIMPTGCNQLGFQGIVYPNQQVRLKKGHSPFFFPGQQGTEQQYGEVWPGMCLTNFNLPRIWDAALRPLAYAPTLPCISIHPLQGSDLLH